MKRINFNSLRKCDDLYNYQSNVFDFENGIVDEVGAFYPMPIKARDLIIQGHYSKPIDSNTPDKLTKFNYQSYFEGVKSGYNELLPKDNAKILELAATDIILKYTEVDRVCSNTNAYEFGEAVGRLYHAWIYIADNIEEFIQLFNQKDIDKTFSDYLICKDKKTLIEKIRKADRNTPKAIYIILKTLFDNGLLLIINNETIFKAYFNEFGYKRNYDTLKRGLNTYDFKKPDKNNIQNISNMYDYLKN